MGGCSCRMWCWAWDGPGEEHGITAPNIKMLTTSIRPPPQRSCGQATAHSHARRSTCATGCHHNYNDPARGPRIGQMRPDGACRLRARSVICDDAGNGGWDGGIWGGCLCGHNYTIIYAVSYSRRSACMYIFVCVCWRV